MIYFLSNLNEIISNKGTFFIKEALEFNSKKLNVVCLLPEIVNKYIMLIFKSKELNNENSISIILMLLNTFFNNKSWSSKPIEFYKNCFSNIK